MELLDDPLTKSVAALMAEDLVDLDRVARDGMRVRAGAGMASFRRRPTLEEALPEPEAKEKPDPRDEVRCSTTDPEATVMEMADGGFRPAYSVQSATEYGEPGDRRRGGPDDG